MLGGEREHLESVVGEGRHPVVGVEAGRVPGFVKLLVGLLGREVHGQERPGFAGFAGDGIDAPMDAHAVLEIAECLEGFRRSVLVARDGLGLHVIGDGLDLAVVGRNAQVGVRSLRRGHFEQRSEATESNQQQGQQGRGVHDNGGIGESLPRASLARSNVGRHEILQVPGT